jgi:hypothetical protein
VYVVSLRHEWPGWAGRNIDEKRRV